MILDTYRELQLDRQTDKMTNDWLISQCRTLIDINVFECGVNHFEISEGSD